MAGDFLAAFCKLHKHADDSPRRRLLCSGAARREHDSRRDRKST
jgi:hypothetical protein